MAFWGNVEVYWDMATRMYQDAVDYLRDLVPDEYKAQPGDPGYWDPGSVDPEVDIIPYLPGVDTAQEMADSLRYWQDYRKNTGFRPRYPGMAIHTPNAAQTVNSFDWWLP